MASTSVVLPWSTWAMMAMLRMSLRVDMGLPWYAYNREQTSVPRRISSGCLCSVLWMRPAVPMRRGARGSCLVWLRLFEVVTQPQSNDARETRALTTFKKLGLAPELVAAL